MTGMEDIIAAEVMTVVEVMNSDISKKVVHHDNAAYMRLN